MSVVCPCPCCGAAHPRPRPAFRHHPLLPPAPCSLLPVSHVLLYNVDCSVVNHNKQYNGQAQNRSKLSALLPQADLPLASFFRRRPGSALSRLLGCGWFKAAASPSSSLQQGKQDVSVCTCSWGRLQSLSAGSSPTTHTVPTASLAQSHTAHLLLKPVSCPVAAACSR